MAIAMLRTAIIATALALPGCTRTVHREAEGALGPYAGSVESAGIVFVSGKIGDRSGDFAHETRTAIDAVAEELGRAGLALDDVVSATVFLTDLDRYGEFNEIYAERFGPPYPARACVEVARLPGDARVEIQVIARGGFRTVPAGE